MKRKIQYLFIFLPSFYFNIFRTAKLRCNKTRVFASTAKLKCRKMQFFEIFLPRNFHAIKYFQNRCLGEAVTGCSYVACLRLIPLHNDKLVSNKSKLQKLLFKFYNKNYKNCLYHELIQESVRTLSLKIRRQFDRTTHQRKGKI